MLLTDLSDGALTLTLNRPDVMNALNAPFAQRFWQRSHRLRQRQRFG